MPLAATHRNFKRNRCLGDGSDSQLRARLAARAERSGAEWGGVGHAAVRKCIMEHSGLGPPSVVRLKIVGNQNNNTIVQRH